MQRNRKEETLKKNKVKKYEDTTGNNINVHINVGHNENDESDNSNQIDIPQPIMEKKIIVDDSEIKAQDELVAKLKFEVKKFNKKKEELINSKIDIPNDIFDLPDIELNSNDDIIKYTDIIRSKIILLEQLLISSNSQKPLISESSRFPNIPPSNNNFQTFSRSPYEFMYQQPSRYGYRINEQPINQQPITRNPIIEPIVQPNVQPIVDEPADADSPAPEIVQPIVDEPADADSPAPEIVQPIVDEPADADSPAPEIVQPIVDELTEEEEDLLNDLNIRIKKWKDENADIIYMADIGYIENAIEGLKRIKKKISDYKKKSQGLIFREQINQIAFSNRIKIQKLQQQIEAIKEGNPPQIPDEVNPDIDIGPIEEELDPNPDEEEPDPNPDEFTEGSSVITQAHLNQVNNRIGEIDFYKGQIKNTPGRDKRSGAIIENEIKNYYNKLKLLKKKINEDDYTLQDLESVLDEKVIQDYGDFYAVKAFRNENQSFKTSNFATVGSQYGPNPQITLEPELENNIDGKFEAKINGQNIGSVTVFFNEFGDIWKESDRPLSNAELEEKAQIEILKNQYLNSFTNDGIEEPKSPESISNLIVDRDTYRYYIRNLRSYVEAPNLPDNVLNAYGDLIEEALIKYNSLPDV